MTQTADAAGVVLRRFEAADIEAALELWASCEGVELGVGDTRPGLERFLARNPGLSLVAVSAGRLVAAVLVGHDGRRGYIHHLGVVGDRRCCGLGRRLVERALAGLGAAGIGKTHVFVRADNRAAGAFWRRLGWQPRPELEMYSWTRAG